MKPRAPRIGFTLIEMVVMLSILIMVGGTSLSMIKHLVAMSASTDQAILNVREIKRFSKGLRRISHHATSASVDDSNKTLTIEHKDGSRREFKAVNDGVDYHSVIGDTKFHEQYRIMPASDLRFLINDDRNVVQVFIKLAEGTATELVIEAALLGQKVEAAE